MTPYIDFPSTPLDGEHLWGFATLPLNLSLAPGHMAPLLGIRWTNGMITKIIFVTTAEEAEHLKRVSLHTQTQDSVNLMFQQRIFPPLAAYGTPFQQKVWKTLLQIPEGRTKSYKYIAEQVGGASYARAAGTAIGANPLAWIIPCHRVVHSDGSLGNYHWGCHIKKGLLTLENVTL